MIIRDNFAYFSIKFFVEGDGLIESLNSMKTEVVGAHLNRLNMVILFLKSTHNIGKAVLVSTNNKGFYGK